MASNLTRTSLAVGVVNAALKPISMFKEIYVAALFGTTAVMDQFALALGVPTVLASLLVSPTATAFTPIFLGQKDPVAANRFRRMVLGTLALGALAVATAVALFRHQIAALAAHGLDLGGRAVVAGLLLYLAPYLFFLIVGEFQLHTLAALRRFLHAISWKVLMPLSTLAALWILGPSIRSMCIGLIAGAFLVGVGGTLLLRRFGYPGIAFPRLTPALEVMQRQVPLLMLSTALLQINLFVDRVMASTLPAGSVAALGYSYRLLMLAEILLVAPFGQLLLTHFSQQFASGDWRALVATTNRATRSALIVLTPLCVFGTVFAVECTRFVYERGAFTPESSRATGAALAAYLPTILVLGSTFAFPKYFNATQQNAFMLLQTTISLLLNVCFNLLFMHWWGHVGIAASTSLTILIGRMVLYARMRQKLEVREALQGTRHFATLGVGAVLFFGLLAAKPHILPSAENPVRIAVGFLITLGGFGLLAALFRRGDLRELYRALRRPA